MNMVNKLNSHLGNSTSFSSNQKKRNNNKRQSDPTPVSKDDISLTKEAKAKFQFKNNYTELNNCIEMLEKAQERVSSLGHLLQQNSEDLTITDMRYHNFKN
ncbi:MAG: hypothetical protein OEY33_07560, partial [Bdellovibrionales bacterium]|nr:hypothetical protein [Bdellovibrionales bacterium]